MPSLSPVRCALPDRYLPSGNVRQTALTAAQSAQSAQSASVKPRPSDRSSDVIRFSVFNFDLRDVIPRYDNKP